MEKDLVFDLILTHLNVQSQKKIFQILADKTSDLCGIEKESLQKIFERRLSERTFGMGRGIAIFDVKSAQIKGSILVLMTLESKIDFDSLDARPVDLVVALISSSFSSAAHLQRLAKISRALTENSLCDALREAKDEDEIKILMMSGLSDAKAA